MSDQIVDVTVYAWPGLIQCSFTFRALDNHSIDYTPVVFETEVEVEQKLRTFGAEHLPVVLVEYPNGLTHHWCGFRPDEITKLSQYLALEATFAL